MRATLILGLAAVLLLGLGTTLRGDERDLAARVATLEQEVATLKARLDKIEGKKSPERRADRAATIEDLRALKDLAALTVMCEQIPMKDGALDIYGFVRIGDVIQPQYGIFRSKRLGTGPTDKEIEAGDYTNFPWERYRGDGKLEGPPVPLLWERKPDKEGKVLVALSDGTVVHREPR